MSSQENKAGTTDKDFSEPGVDQEVDPVNDEPSEIFPDMLGRPQLLPGESAEALKALEDEVFKELKPNTFLEKLRAWDIVSSLWESSRLRGMSSQIVINAKPSALTTLLSPRFGHRLDIAADRVATMYSGKKEEREKAWKEVQAFKITNAHVNAEAYRQNSMPITMIERGIASRDNLRRMLLKEYSREQKKAAKAKRQQTKTAAEAARSVSAASTSKSQPMPANDVSAPANAAGAHAADDNTSAGVQSSLPRRAVKRRGEAQHG